MISWAQSTAMLQDGIIHFIFHHVSAVKRGFALISLILTLRGAVCVYVQIWTDVPLNISSYPPWLQSCPHVLCWRLALEKINSGSFTGHASLKMCPRCITDYVTEILCKIWKQQHVFLCVNMPSYTFPVNVSHFTDCTCAGHSSKTTTGNTRRFGKCFITF